MPTYPFERTSYWVAPVKRLAAAVAEETVADSVLNTEAAHPGGNGTGTPATVLDRIKEMLATVGGIPAASVDPGKTYIEMGFDSLGLMQLEVVVGKELGVKVSWRQLLEDYSTPAKLEALARATNPALDGPAPQRLAGPPITVPGASPSGVSAIQGLTALREAGPTSIFLAYDGEGDVLQYLKLARAMPPEFSLYGISPSRLPNVPQVHTSVEEMASHCLSVMRTKQPTGPYIVGGLCAGGAIAFEMAAQLEGAGEKVERLVLLDVINPQTPFRPFLQTRDRLRHFLGNQNAGATAPAAATGAEASPSSAVTASSLLDRARHAAGKARNLIAYEVEHQLDSVWVATRVALLRKTMNAGREWPEWMTAPRELEIYMTVKGKYRPGTIEADIVLVRASMVAEGVDAPAQHFVTDPYFGWQGHTNGELRTIDAAGGHVSMLLDEPWFGELAEKLGKALLFKRPPQPQPAPVATATVIEAAVPPA